MKDSKLLLLILASLEKPRQSICNRICLTLAIVNLEIVSKELFGPLDLSGAQAFCIHKTTEIIIIYKYENLMLATFQIVTPPFEGLDNSQKLIVVGLIPSLCKNHLPKKEDYWLPQAQIGLSDYPIRTSSGN